jgi:hypothetical protein
MNMQDSDLKTMLEISENSTCEKLRYAFAVPVGSKSSRMDLISSRSWQTSDSKAEARCSAVLFRSSASFSSDARSVSRVLIFNCSVFSVCKSPSRIVFILSTRTKTLFAAGGIGAVA